MNQSRQFLSKGFCFMSTRNKNAKELTFKINCRFYCKNSSEILRTGTIINPKFITNENTSNLNNLKQSLASQQRLVRIKSKENTLQKKGFFNVVAYTTAEQYNLEGLLYAMEQQNLYVAKNFFSTDNLGVQQDVLYVTAIYKVDTEPRDIFFFRNGCIILWNFNELESNNLLNFVKNYERDRYLKPLVTGEREIMPYTYLNDAEERAKFKNGTFMLRNAENNFYDKYTFSNAMATSIKLGIWEAILDRYIDNMQFMTDDLKKGRRIRINRADLLRKTGELFALRHSINLSSDLLDTPDFYWDREELEAIFLQVCKYFSITRRTKVMNDKLNHCVELAELVSSNLNDIHHVRLEWMIIILIMVEVGFEIIHYADRYLVKDNENEQDTRSVIKI